MVWAGLFSSFVLTFSRRPRRPIADKQNKALFTSPVFSPPKDVGIYGDLVFTQYSQIPSNTLPQKYSTMMESFLSSQKYTIVEEICGDIPGLFPQNPD
jgi:hypothetical protein